MAKGPLITDKVKLLIARLYRQHPKWTAQEIRDEASYLLGKDDPTLLPSYPALSTVQKLLATFRKRDIPDPLDASFSLGAVFAHNIPAEVIPLLLDLQHRNPMNIRMAKWVAKLHVAVAEISKYDDFDHMLTILGDLAFIYALHEKGWELLIGELEGPFDTSDLDAAFLMPKYDEEDARKKIDALKRQSTDILETTLKGERRTP